MTTQMEAAAASLLVVWNTLQAKLSTAVNPDELLMTPEEVSAYTGVSVQALAMLRYRGNGGQRIHRRERTGARDVAIQGQWSEVPAPITARHTLPQARRRYMGERTGGIEMSNKWELR